MTGSKLMYLSWMLDTVGGVVCLTAWFASVFVIIVQPAWLVALWAKWHRHSERNDIPSIR
jgi:hypothetical protein